MEKGDNQNTNIYLLKRNILKSLHAKFKYVYLNLHTEKANLYNQYTHIQSC